MRVSSFSGFSVGFHINEKFTILNLMTENPFPDWNLEYHTRVLLSTFYL